MDGKIEIPLCEYIPCQKDTILKELHEDHESLKLGMTERLAASDSRYSMMDAKLDTLIEHGEGYSRGIEALNKRLFFDNGSKSIQTRINNNKTASDANERAIAQINDRLGWIRGAATTAMVGVILLLLTAVIEHIIPAIQ